jgi:hypothetical protein
MGCDVPLRAGAGHARLMCARGPRQQQLEGSTLHGYTVGSQEHRGSLNLEGNTLLHQQQNYSLQC